MSNSFTAPSSGAAVPRGSQDGAGSLAQALVPSLRALLGRERVLASAEDLEAYSFDATAGLEPIRPAVVVFPETTEEVQKIVQLAAEAGTPLFPRGSGTNLSGGTLPLSQGIVVEFSRMDRILEVDAANLTATVQPGVVIQALNDAVAPLGLLYPPDPGTVTTATMGGSVAECSGGLRGLKYGVTKHYVLGLTVVLADGEILRLGGKTVKNVAGYDLVALFTGSEGTLGIITEILVRLIPAPAARRSMLASFTRLEDAAQAITGIFAARVIPATLEIMDQVTLRVVEDFTHAGLPVDAAAVLLVEVDGDPAAVEREARTVEEICRQHGAAVTVARSEAEREQLWTARRQALPALARVRPTVILEDATVPRSQIPAMLAELQRIAEKYRLKIGTFGHAGDGNLHPTILTDVRDKEEMARVNQAVEEIFQAALALGGTLSGEHGIGLAKRRFMEWQFGAAGLQALRAIKQALDPQGLLNPGKVVEP